MASFTRPGIVSVWIGQVAPGPKSNVLRKFGVDHYDPDFRDNIIAKTRSPVRDLVSQLSYSESFIDPLLRRAAELGISSAIWMLAQYDFAYDPVKAGLSVLPKEPLYVGNFSWNDELVETK
jgi:hypothetical protein